MGSGFEMKYNTNYPWLTLVVPVFAFMFVTYATRYFVGISPDSTFYISAAESIRHTGEIRRIFEGSKWAYMTHYPPGYSLILYVID